MPLSVNLIDHTNDPLTLLYLAYKQAVSKRSLADVRRDIESGKISREKIRSFIEEQAAVGHTSPYYLIHFTFQIEGISRACANQLVRHHVGTAFEQQSLRYVQADGIPVVMPPDLDDETDSSAGGTATSFFVGVDEAQKAYRAILADGVTTARPEDARYVLPLGTETALLMDANFGALLHMCDLRLCTQAQWEIRNLFKEVRKRVLEVEPVLGRMLAPKCMPWRGAVCDESVSAWSGCPLGCGTKDSSGSFTMIRPHKSQVSGGRVSNAYVDQALDVVTE